jgi:hypothetical protein
MNLRTRFESTVSETRQSDGSFNLSGAVPNRLSPAENAFCIRSPDFTFLNELEV